jgi:chaperone BCS1
MMRCTTWSGLGSPSRSFARKSRRFVVNTNLNSRMWWLFRDFGEDGDRDEEDDDSLGNRINWIPV